MRLLYALVIMLGTAGLFRLDSWARHLTDSDASFRAFILSDAFFPALLISTVVALAVLGLLVTLAAFIPSRSGRQTSEHGK